MGHAQEPSSVPRGEEGKKRNGQRKKVGWRTCPWSWKSLECQAASELVCQRLSKAQVEQGQVKEMNLALKTQGSAD